MKYVVILLASLFIAVSVPHVGATVDFNISVGVTPAVPPPPDEQMEPLPPYEEFEYEEFEDEAVAPPPLEFETEPDMVVVPSGESYVYMVPNRPGLYFYGGDWYRYYRGYWYQSPDYYGRWNGVGVSLVPGVIVGVPPEYVTYLPPTYTRIRYHDFNRGWKTWDSNRHWHKREWFNNERKSEVRKERFDHIRADREKMRKEGRSKYPDGGKGRDADGGRSKRPESAKSRGADGDRTKHPEGGKGRDADGGQVRHPDGAKGRGADGGQVKQKEQDRLKQEDKDKNKDKNKDKKKDKDKNKDKDKD